MEDLDIEASDFGTPLLYLGIDSLGLTDLIVQIQQKFGLEVDIVELSENEWSPNDLFKVVSPSIVGKLGSFAKETVVNPVSVVNARPSNKNSCCGNPNHAFPTISQQTQQRRAPSRSPPNSNVFNLSKYQKSPVKKQK
eukprot:UN17384